MCASKMPAWAKFPTEGCSQHYMENAAYFCESCAEAVCTSCVLAHQQHQYCDFSEYKRLSLKNLEALRSKSEKLVDECEEARRNAVTLVESEVRSFDKLVLATVSKLNTAVALIESVKTLLTAAADEAVQEFSDTFEASGAQQLPERAKKAHEAVQKLAQKASFVRHFKKAEKLTFALMNIQQDCLAMKNTRPILPKLVLDSSLSGDVACVYGYVQNLERNFKKRTYNFSRQDAPESTKKPLRLTVSNPARMHTNVNLPNRLNTKEIIMCAGGFTTDGIGMRKVEVNQGYLSTVVMYDATSESWCKAAAMKSERLYAAATVWNSTVVLAGGGNPTALALNSVEQYHPEFDIWTPFRSLLTARRGLALVTVNLTMFAFGGCDGVDFLKSTESYNKQNNKWTNAPSMKIARLSPSAGVIQRGIVVAGGKSSMNTIESSSEYYNHDKKKWKSIASLNTGRYCAAAAVHGCKFYIFGGWNEVPLYDAEQYELKAAKWTVLRVQLKSASSKFAAAAIDGRIYVVGGIGANSDVKRDVTCFDPVEHCMQNATQLPLARYGAAAVSLLISEAAYSRICWGNFDS